ncbi:PAS domain S-box-containing protein/diguanylate cyclase (GGDEF) domain-containing protein [Desulfomicrobium apsheronum]|uniref:PAS domain S-box-containing protein/diguanylate cyclase (GGDEF) domain-containing protein n=1 Tax=Desulfomicrobium apsheronum TaxID=52560 RepID=A0A1I3VV39_9BACT|nr:diguanylate cyclase [Desulfomicrobium apsheronum]SFJ99105.1 PAS domain S-box-containing protein/diguanylate cyclase (GGDEF) domain-containing protein [Desulfomicrobium apsheronum]
MTCTTLFVDDDQAVLDSIRTNLHSKFSIVTATDPREIIPALEAGKRFAVVVSDFKMPGMDGITFLSRVKDLDPDSARIMLTGHADIKAASKAVNEGNLLRFLIKPCSLQDITNSVYAGLEHHKIATSERELRQRMEMVIHGTASGTWDMNVQKGEMSVNETWQGLLGHTDHKPSRIKLHQAQRMMHPEERRIFSNALRSHLHGLTPHFTCDVRLRHRSDAWRWMRICGKITGRDEAGKPLRMSGIMTDIHEDKLTKQALTDQISFLDEMIDAFPYPVFVKSADAKFASVNCAYERFFGVRRAEIVGKAASDLGHLPKAPNVDFKTEYQRIVREFGASHHEVTFSAPDGQTRHCLHWSHAFRHEETGVQGLVGTIVDISEQKLVERELAEKNRKLADSEAKLKQLSLTDELTGLGNRRFFKGRIREALSLSMRHGHPLSLMMADLDHFKFVNDVFGHNAGDLVLQGFAKILRTICRKEDTPCRSGGEEFMIILPMTSVQEAEMLGSRICHAMRENDFLGNGAPVTVSIGVTQYERNESYQTFLERVDQSLYRAKKQGRDRVCS